MESLFALIVTASAVSFWAIIVLLFIFIVLSLGFFKGIHAGSVLFFLFAGLLYIRFDPSWAIMVTLFFAWFIFGIVYARSRWNLQILKLKNRVIEAWNNFPSKKEAFTKDRVERQKTFEKDRDANLSRFTPEKLEDLEERQKRNEEETRRQEERVYVDLENCELNALPYVKWQEEDNQSTILTKFRPQFSMYRATITAWAVAWPLYLIKDFTIDLVRNLLELLRGSFQRAADKAFS